MGPVFTHCIRQSDCGLDWPYAQHMLFFLNHRHCHHSLTIKVQSPGEEQIEHTGSQIFSSTIQLSVIAGFITR